MFEINKKRGRERTIFKKTRFGSKTFVKCLKRYDHNSSKMPLRQSCMVPLGLVVVVAKKKKRNKESIKLIVLQQSKQIFFQRSPLFHLQNTN